MDTRARGTAPVAPVSIRPAQAADADAIWRILEPTLRAGETYALPSDLGREAALAYWTGSDRETFVAEAERRSK